MTQARIAIVFYSTYGTNHQVALAAAEAAKAAGADVRLRRIAETAPADVVAGQEAWKAQLDKVQDIPEVSHDDMEWANGYFFISPTRYGAVASQMRAFIDTLGGLWFAGKLANKTFTAATSAQNTHGGQESTILGLYTTAMHWGAVIVAPGFTDAAVSEAGGNPYGFSTNAGALDDKGRAAVAHQAKRLVEMTAKLAA
ncbi:MAG: NAD(P)H-dependent oxidoreductase [Paracoccaceae bacterium]|jgi:NAD(P)H dehydrogenase (quinone)|uniref:NAD(P)H-dependent oxidoreductase n=1 Tax=unclassified Seohaeicola TaxID=2641111 RepID=UPI00237BF617|nr:MULTISPECIES: NAD(P)H-dependent oxidoreductase [unclassified Seohaeicola]MDD9708223.1 NAD(P)H-dependent oxidoreductase [Seohaeicola sp. 4SK31]MDD9736379.1 NAD(P)H-dependent oxidoreductase [Seohaeicola sp. SP36]MDF1707529.1 NAD(P)H-dependent oxidoreductase [Paracoccaceae bacterium]MDM7969469.1 NAD(P)H-dependent oxidoreductase [Paracoccaceae bacterium]